MIQTHETTDSAALHERLRQARREGHHKKAIEALGYLVELGEWLPAWEAGQQWLEASRGPSPTPVVIRGEGVKDVIFERVEEKRWLARHAANALRLLAPHATFAIRTIDILNVVIRRGVPNPLPLYIEALQIWWPEGWFLWLHEMACGCGSMTDSDGQFPLGNSYIYHDGGGEFGSTCPPLPEVPEKP
jgi:hypothetical protein